MQNDQEGLGPEPGGEVERPLTGRMDRRRFVKLVGAAGVAAGFGPVLAACGGDDEEAAPAPPAATGETGAAPPPAAGGATGRPIKIGLVSPQTGPLALFGETDTYVVGEMPRRRASSRRLRFASSRRARRRRPTSSCLGPTTLPPARGLLERDVVLTRPSMLSPFSIT